MLRLFRVFTIAAVMCALAWSQSGTGTIQGTVRDQVSAVIPGATVKALHVPTSGLRETTTNTAGFFVFPAMAIGEYELTVEAPGMQGWQAALVLQVGQTAVVQPVLHVGSTTTEITVAGDVTPLLVESSSTLGQVLGRVSSNCR